MSKGVDLGTSLTNLGVKHVLGDVETPHIKCLRVASVGLYIHMNNAIASCPAWTFLSAVRQRLRRLHQHLGASKGGHQLTSREFEFDRGQPIAD